MLRSIPKSSNSNMHFLTFLLIHFIFPLSSSLFSFFFPTRPLFPWSSAGALPLGSADAPTSPPLFHRRLPISFLPHFPSLGSLVLSAPTSTRRHPRRWPAPRRHESIRPLRCAAPPSASLPAPPPPAWLRAPESPSDFAAVGASLYTASFRVAPTDAPPLCAASPQRLSHFLTAWLRTGGRRIRGL